MTPYYENNGVRIYHGDSLDVLSRMDSGTVHCCVTSPPFWGLRDYGADGQMGLESTPDEYVAKMVAVFAEVRRVLRDDGTLWLNVGDSYAAQGGDHAKSNANQPNVGAMRCHANGSGDKGTRRPAEGLKPKDLVGIPWMLAFALRADGSISGWISSGPSLTQCRKASPIAAPRAMNTSLCCLSRRGTTTTKQRLQALFDGIYRTP